VGHPVVGLCQNVNRRITNIQEGYKSLG